MDPYPSRLIGPHPSFHAATTGSTRTRSDPTKVSGILPMRSIFIVETYSVLTRASSVWPTVCLGLMDIVSHSLRPPRIPPIPYVLSRCMYGILTSSDTVSASGYDVLALWVRKPDIWCNSIGTSSNPGQANVLKSPLPGSLYGLLPSAAFVLRCISHFSFYHLCAPGGRRVRP